MDIGAIQPQIWFSILLVVAAGGIAALATLIKNRNDRLRDILLELRARHEEDQRRLSWERMNHAVQSPAAQRQFSEPRVSVAALRAGVPPAAGPLTAAPAAAALEVAASKAPATCSSEDVRETPALRDSEVRDRNLAIRRAEERAMDFASRQGRRRHPGPPPDSLPKLDEMSPREALSEWLNKRAAARSSQKTAPAAKPPQSHNRQEPPPEPTSEHEEAVAEPSRDHKEEFAQPAAAEPKQPAVFIDESLWTSILGQSPAREPVEETVPNLRFEVIQGASTGLPAGLHHQPVLSRLLESNKPFQGLAVAVGVNLNDGRAVSQSVMLHIEQLVCSLLAEGDFACRTGDDEFLLLCPGKLGAEAQRRLSDISERLWDFQLRGVGNFSILFSTGDAQVKDQTLREAVIAASGRLQQARRARKMVSLDSGSSRKTASAAV